MIYAGIKKVNNITSQCRGKNVKIANTNNK